MIIGIIGASDIAFRRFLPSLMKCQDVEYAGVASRSLNKASGFKNQFGGNVYKSYDDLINDPHIDAVYLPLPPALHYQWGKKVLVAGKHLLMEKPFTTCLSDTVDLLAIAKERELTVHENYAFVYHHQLRQIKRIISSGELGDLRQLKMSFGFPKRSENDFRYNNDLGGGALLDCGGYPVRLSVELLGNDTQLVQCQLNHIEGFSVDMFGSAVLKNDKDLCSQISFGMDNAYQCSLEIWGSKKTLIAPRIFTAGADFKPSIILKSSNEDKTLELEPDDQFQHSIEAFLYNIHNRKSGPIDIIKKQSEIIEQLKEGNWK